MKKSAAQFLLIGASATAIVAASAASAATNVGSSYTNSGVASGVSGAVFLFNTAGTLTNNGTISSSDAATPAVIASATSGTVLINSSGRSITNSGVAVEGVKTITNAGTISSTGDHAVVASGTSATGITNTGTISSSGGNAIHALTGSAVTITNSGTVSSSAGHAIDVASATSATITNQSGGTIASTAGSLWAAVRMAAGQIFTNAGTVTSDGYGVSVASGTGSATITNTGTITAATGSNNAGIYLAGNAAITNSGTITGTGTASGIEVASGVSTSSTITNSGTIRSTGAGSGVEINGVMASITNTGTISSTSGTAITIGSAGQVTGSITNSGTISGGGGTAIDASASSADLTVNNSGAVIGDILFGSGDDTLAVSGSGTITGDVDGGSGTDVTNFTATAFVSGGTIADVEDINVTSGSATFNHAVTGSTTFDISSGAEVDMFASFTSGTLTNAGTLNVGTGTRTLTGNYVQSASGAFNVGINSTTNGVMNVSGSATVADSSQVNVDITSGYEVPDATAYTVIDAASMTLTTPSSLTITSSDPFVVFAASTASGNLILTSSGATDDQAADQILDNVGFDDATELADAAGGSAAGSNITSAFTAFTSFLGDLRGADFTAFTAINDLITDATGDQFVEFMRDIAPSTAVTAGASAGVQTAGAGTSGTISNRVNVARAGDAIGMAAGDSSKLAMWAQPFAAHTSQGQKDGIDGYESGTYGMVVGLDRLVTDHFRLGVAGGYNTSDVDARGSSAGSGAEIDGYSLNLYGSYSLSNWYVDGQLGVGMSDVESTRLVSLSGDTYRADFDALQYNAQIATGVNLRAGGFVITPNAFVNYAALNQDNYTETGSGSLGLVVNNDDTQNTYTGIGVRAAYPVALASGGVLTPEARVNYLHTFGDEKMVTTSSLGSSSFTTNSMEIDRNAIGLGGGLSYQFNDDYTLNADVDYTKRDTSNALQGLLKLRANF